jgi:cytochrome P450
MASVLPPGPKTTWLRGNLAEFQRDQLEFLTESARTYGDMVSIRLGPRRLILVNRPEFIEQVLVTHNASFRKHFALRLNPLVFGNGLLTSEGDFWLRQRRLIQPTFARARLASYAPAMVEETTRLLDSWVPGTSREISNEMMRLTLAITARTLFGADVDSQAAAIGEALRLLQENFLVRLRSLAPLPFWVPTPQNLRIRRTVRRLDDILFGFIHQRRQNQKAETSNDLLSLLLSVRDEDGSQMSDRQVRDEAMTLFLAGHETTALALSWTWYLLSQHPEAEEQLVAEVRAVVGERLPTAQDVPRLVFMDQVLQESMRLFPPVYIIGREASERCTIGGFDVARGTTMLMSQWIMHRDPRFFEAPTEFRPSRWTPEFDRQLPGFAYFPFGGGPRLCIGNTFALLEMALILATMAQRFRFTLQPGHQVRPWPSFTLRPLPGILAPVVTRGEG